MPCKDTVIFMKIKSVKFNFIMNFILTSSSFIFPLITVPYISRVLLVEGNGKVALAASILTYFAMFASLGIPTYGIRACAKVRDNKKELSKTVQEILIINTVTTALTFIAFLLSLFLIPSFAGQKEILLVNSTALILNLMGVTWLYSALEQYAYITIRTLAFKIISIVLMFLLVKNVDHYVTYAAISVFAGAGSNVLNFINLRKLISFKKTGKYEFKRHLKPIIVFFAMSAAISVYTNLDIVMLGFMRGAVDVGYYNAAIKVKTLLVALITSLGAVLLPRLSYFFEQKNTEEFERIIVKAFNFVLVLGVGVTVYFTVFAGETILLLNGKEFEGAVIPMMWLMPTVLFIGLSNVTGIQVLTPTGNERKVLYSIIIGAITDFLLNLALIPNYGASGAAFATMVAELVVLGIQVVYLRSMLFSIVKKLEITKIFIAAFAAALCGIILKLLTELSPFMALLSTGLVFFGVFGWLLLLLKEDFVYGLMVCLVKTVKNRLSR